MSTVQVLAVAIGHWRTYYHSLRKSTSYSSTVVFQQLNCSTIHKKFNWFLFDASNRALSYVDKYRAMRIARVQTEEGPVSGEYVDGTVTTESGQTVTVDEDTPLLPPCTPTTLYCAGRNYQDYLELKGNERPTTPHFFLKPPAALWPAHRTLPYPSFAKGVGYAGELAAVIGEACRGVDTDEANEYVLGYTIMNDLDALGEEGAGMKVFQASAPLGPWIETDVDPMGLDLKTTIAGETRQDGNTDEMLFEPMEIVSFLSNRIELQPGDVIAFGSPANPGDVPPGETIEIWYEGIGTLVNDLGHPETD